jgi:MATE family multidrug resistance protein
MGVMLGLDALVASSYGARRLDDCVRWLQHGVLVALVVAPTVMLIFYAALTTSAHWGLHPSVRAQAQPYMTILGLGAVPLLLYATFRRYLQGIHAVRPVMTALVTANLVNVFGNWVLIWGHSVCRRWESMGRHGRRLPRASTWPHFSASRSRVSTESAAGRTRRSCSSGNACGVCSPSACRPPRR